MFIPNPSAKLSLVNLSLPAVFLFAALAYVDVFANENMRIRLKDGSFASGELIAAEEAGRLGWKTSDLRGTMQFNIEALRSVTKLVDDGPPKAGANSKLFELTNGELLVGQLVDVNRKEVVVESELLGTLAIDRSRVLTISDAAYAGDLVYQGPTDNGSWKSESPDLPWEFEAGALATTAQGAAVVGDVDLPMKAQVNLVLTWSGVPDFVISFGTDHNTNSGNVNSLSAAARLEVWERQLAIVREVDGGADIALVSDLKDVNPRIELTLYIDHEAGTVTVCDSYGRPMDTVSAKAEKPNAKPCIHIVHHGSGLSLEKLEVRKWDGETRIEFGEENGFVVLTDGSQLDASIVGFDANTNKLQLASSKEMAKEVSLKDVRRATFAKLDEAESPDSQDENHQEVLEEGVPESPPPAEQPPAQRQASDSDAGTEAALGEFDDLFAPVSESKEDESKNDKADVAKEASNAPIAVEVVLDDRTRVRGEWLAGRNNLIRLRVPGLATLGPHGSLDFVAFHPSRLRGVIGTDARFELPEVEERRGTLKLENAQIVGYLESNSPAESNTALFWHPLASLGSHQITESASGAIIYKKMLPKVKKVQQQENPRNNRAAPMLNIFLGGRVKPREKPVPESENKDRELMFRTGDGIYGTVNRVDEAGVYFTSSQTSTTFAKHNQMQSVVLNRQIHTKTTSDQKLARLMTVPRSMKNDPPTHLLIGVNGDFLRGRLVAVSADVVTVEVRLEILDIPAEKIAEIIWLHDREWDEDKKKTEDKADVADAEEELPFRVHGISSSEKGLTFRPTKMVDGVIQGTSDLLGDCSINVMDANQILFGRNIGLRVREFREDPWTLSLAQFPRVFDQTDEPNDPNAGTQSELVGVDAPNIFLDTLEGQKFNLRKNQDRVVVLDFWASWCGPCVQTMPLVETAMEEIGDERVQLVAVNIQESPDRVQRAVASLGISALVALDVDGEIAAAYRANAIPQTVVIDKNGRITHVFVGGGARVVAQLKNAVLSVLGDPIEEPGT